MTLKLDMKFYVFFMKGKKNYNGILIMFIANQWLTRYIFDIWILYRLCKN